MTEIPDSLRALFETSVAEDDGRYVVRIPAELVEDGSLSEDELYRIAVLSSDAPSPPEDEQVGDASEQSRDQQPQSQASTSRSQSSPSEGASEQSSRPEKRDRHNRGSQEGRTPPVTEGEERTVAIDALGDQGDGIARVERGFILIVPGTKPGDTVEIRITDVKDSVAFAEPISEATVR